MSNSAQSSTNPSAPEATRPAFELDHAKDGDTRYFVIHGRLPKGLNAEYGYPICDSMNRHHCISPEEDEAYGRLIVLAVNSYDDMLVALKNANKLLNHMGDILNGMDAVTPEDQEMATPIFEQVRAAIAKAGTQ